MDTYNLKQYIKNLRRKDVLVALATGFVLVFTGISFLLFLTILRPQKPLPQITDTSVSTPELNLLPDLVTYREENGQQIPEGLPVIYTVQPGDSTWKIAQAFFGSGFNYVDIERANNLQPDQQLQAGQKLTIPAVAMRSVSAPLAQRGAVEPDQASTSTQVSAHYTIQRGDCLWTIAEKQLNDPYRWTEIYQLNKSVIGNNPDLIYPDVELELPLSQK